MSRVLLYVDEDAEERAVVEGLRRRSIDVLTVLDVQMTHASDEEQLEFAACQGRSIYTLNVDDFCRLHRTFMVEGRVHAGIIVIPRQRYSIGEKIQRLVGLVESLSAEQMQNRLEFL